MPSSSMLAVAALLALAIACSPAAHSQPAPQPPQQVVPPPNAPDQRPPGTNAEIAPYPAPPAFEPRQWGYLEPNASAFPDNFLGPYFVNGDSTHRVVMTSRFNNRIYLEQPGEWSGAGVIENGTDYWGVFQYHADAATRELRGARGSQAGHVDPDGLVHVQFTFVSPKRAPLSYTWVPSPQMRMVLGDRIGSPRSITREQLRHIPVDTLYQRR